MITVSQYNHSEHFVYLQALHDSWGAFFGETEETLPKLGYIASEGSIVVAICFLRKMEGGFAMIDTLVSNKDLASEFRHLGVQAVVDAVIAAARNQGIKGLICLTSDEGVFKRAMGMGFTSLNKVSIGLIL